MSPKLKKIKLESSVENQKSDLETEDQNTPPPVKIVKTGEEYFDPEEYDEFSKWINTVEKEIMLPRDSPVSKRAEKNFKTSKKQSFIGISKSAIKKNTKKDKKDQNKKKNK